MVPSNVKSSKARRPHEPQMSQDIGKAKRRHRPKSKRREPLAESPAQASTSVNAAEQPKSWPWVSITEPPTTKHPPVFTKDGNYFFSIVGSSVKVYSTVTGLVVSTLSAKRDVGSHTNAITSVVVNPHNAFQLITGSLDGRIKVWDLLDGVLLQTIGVGSPVRHLAAHERWKDFLFVAIARPSKKRKANGDDDNCVVLRVSLKPSPATLQQQPAVQTSSESTLVGKTRTTRGLAVSASGSWLVAIGGHKAYVASTANLKSGFVKFVSPETLTCLAFHPTEEYFATGDDKGHIRLWYCLHETIATTTAAAAAAAKPQVEKRAPTSTLHWHAHAVSALTFTLNGAYLLSGGEESVLVMWQIHSGKREFVPRVGAPIDSVVVSRTQGGEEDYLLGLADGSFVFISSMDLKISRSYSGIKLDPAISNSRPSASASTPLAVHSLSSTLILPSSHPSSLQAYSPSSSKLISELEVSPSNRVSRRDEKMLEPSRVEQAVVSSSGEWLATIDSREGDAYFRGEVHLKIWRWESSTGLWTLNTRIDRPHGLARVTSIVFSPNDGPGNILVTSGEDGNVKTWRIRSVANKKTGTSDVFWVARSSVNFKRETPWTVSWSPDGSLLAAGFGAYVAIYDPPSNALIRAFVTSELRGRIRFVQFLGNEGRFLVVAGRSNVVLWDLVTEKVQWHHRSAQPVSAVVSHPRDECLAVFSSQPPSSTVSVFGPSASSPLHTYTLPFALRNIVWYPQLPPKSKETSSFHLVGITDDWDVVVCGDDVHSLVGEGTVARGLVSSSQGPHNKTLLQDIFGDSALAVAPVEPFVQKDIASALLRNGKEIGDIFAGPAYLIPPLETLFEPLMKHFLIPRPSEDETIPVSGLPRADEEEDADMDVDESQDSPLVSGARPERVVDAREMDALIELFRHHGVKATSTHAPLSNGHVPEIHGNAHKMVNGRSHTPNSKANNSGPHPHPNTETPSGRSSPPESPSQTKVLTSSPAVAGKKRKKMAVS